MVPFFSLLLRCRSFFLLPLSLRRSYFLLRRRSYSCTRLASLQHVGGHAFAHAHQDTARNNTHTNNTHGTHVTHATPTFRSFCPGVPPGGLPCFGGAFVCCAAGAQGPGPRLPPSNDALEASILFSRCTVDVRGCFNNFLLAVWLRHGIVWMPTTHCV